MMRIERIAAAFAMSAMCCCAAEKGVNVKMPFLWSSAEIDAQTTEVAVDEGNFSVRTLMPSEDAVSRSDLGVGGPIVTNRRYRIMGKAKTQWYGVDYMVLAEGVPVTDGIDTWVDAGVLLTGNPDLAAPSGTVFRTVAFTRVAGKDDSFLAKHKADRMSAHSGTIEIGGRFHRAYVVCINRGRESWKLIAVFPLSPGIKENEARRETAADVAAAGMFFGSFKIGGTNGSSSVKDSAEYVQRLLDEKGWRYLRSEEGDWTLFVGGVGGRSDVYDGYRFFIFVGDNSVQNFTFYPESSKDRLPQVIEFITMANDNYNLEYGAFKIDHESGEVRYHFSLPVSAIRADKKLFSLLLSVPVAALDKYAKGFSNVVSGKKLPAAAIKEIK